MLEQRDRLIQFHCCPKISRALLTKMMQVDPNFSSLPQFTSSQWQSTFKLPYSEAQFIYHYLQQTTPRQILSSLQTKRIHVITIFDQDYPPLLKQIYDPPYVLFGLGKRELLQTNKNLAVVGTRNPSQTGIEAVKTLIPPVAKEGWTIVSGFATGIDSVAHWQTIQAGGHTIAVLGSGFNYIYPKQNYSLFEYLSQNHLLLSEYPPATPPQKWYFPARNRIISGLSQAVLVIEAKEKSGSLITADQALEQGRDVFAVPGSIFSDQALGTNYLIQQGAKLVRKADDILEEMRF